MNQPFHVIIPARFDSVRLPGKPLLDIAGKPMVVHVLELARASGATSVTVATDDSRVVAAVQESGGDAVLTAAAHQSGSDRIAEACRILGLPGDAVIVNVQGDEPLMPPALISQVAGLLAEDPEAVMATLCTAVEDAVEYADPSAVKVVMNRDGRAIYFSRAQIPWLRADESAENVADAWRNAFRHLGIYAYRSEYIQAFSARGPCELESLERLEQLRTLWFGEAIACAVAGVTPPPGVDTPADLDRARQALLSRR